MKECDHCGRQTVNRRFCSRKCSAVVTNRESPRRKAKAKETKQKLVKPLSECLSANTRRLRMISMFGYRCMECKLTEWRGQAIPLQVDHIDGNCDNNAESNLRLLCMNCHGITSTFGGKNRGKFPGSSRRKYYKKQNAS